MNKLNYIFNKQTFLLKKISIFYSFNNQQTSDYFCSYAKNLGYHIMKYWLKKKNFFFLLKFLLKEIYSIFNTNDLTVYENIDHKTQYTKVVFTWGNDKNITQDDNEYYDTYFRTKASIDESILWIVINSGKKKIKKKNIIFISQKTTGFLKKFNNFFIYLYTCIKEKKFLDIFFDNYNFFSYKILNLTVNLLKNQKNIKKIILPYESQPFQNALIKFFRGYNVETIGYIHSFPAFKSHFVKKKYSPDSLIINSSDQYNTFINFLGWQKKELKIMPSLRFKKSFCNISNKKIYLPITIFDSSKVIDKLKIILSKYDLTGFEIKNHPNCVNSFQHLKLVEKIQNILKNTEQVNFKKKEFSIFIGSTGSIIEALSNNVKIVHILEDPIFQIYSQKFWPSIQTKFIDEDIVEYYSLKKEIIKYSDTVKFYDYF